MLISIAVKEKLLEDNLVFMNFPSTPPSSFALNTQCSKETIKKCARKTCRIQFTSDILAFSFLISILILVIRYSMEYHHKWLLACNSYYLGRPQRLQIMSIVFLYDANFSSKILKRTLHCNAQWGKNNIYCTTLNLRSIWFESIDTFWSIL